MKSQYWKFRIYQSRRQLRQNGNAKTGYCGPYYFETPISFLEFKKWIRKTLGISDTSHIAAEVGLSEARNRQSYNTWKKQMERELNQELNKAKTEKAKTGKARPGNLIVKWLKPEIV